MRTECAKNCPEVVPRERERGRIVALIMFTVFIAVFSFHLFSPSITATGATYTVYQYTVVINTTINSTDLVREGFIPLPNGTVFVGKCASRPEAYVLVELNVNVSRVKLVLYTYDEKLASQLGLLAEKCTARLLRIAIAALATSKTETTMTTLTTLPATIPTYISASSTTTESLHEAVPSTTKLVTICSVQSHSETAHSAPQEASAASISSREHISRAGYEKSYMSSIGGVASTATSPSLPPNRLVQGLYVVVVASIVGVLVLVLGRKTVW